jgi:hypothetical protein
LVKSITFVFPLLHSSPLGAPAAAAIDELLDARFDVCELATDAFADRSNRIPPEATTYPNRAPATNMATAWRFLLRNIDPPSQVIEYQRRQNDFGERINNALHGISRDESKIKTA